MELRLTLFVCFCYVLFCFVFGVIFGQVLMIGVRCTSFLVLSDVLTRTGLKLGGWMDLGPTRIYEVNGEFS